MKSLRYYLPVLALFILPVFQLQAAPLSETPSKEAIANMTKEQKEARLEEIKERVSEIKTMDRHMMTKDERRALRKELKGMHREAKAITGVYISVGALIIIILLLIIIL